MNERTDDERAADRADWARREQLHADRLSRSYTTAAPERTAEERAALQARLDRLTAERLGAAPVDLDAVTAPRPDPVADGLGALLAEARQLILERLHGPAVDDLVQRIDAAVPVDYPEPAEPEDR